MKTTAFSNTALIIQPGLMEIQQLFLKTKPFTSKSPTMQAISLKRVSPLIKSIKPNRFLQSAAIRLNGQIKILFSLQPQMRARWSFTTTENGLSKTASPSLKTAHSDSVQLIKQAITPSKRLLLTKSTKSPRFLQSAAIRLNGQMRTPLSPQLQLMPPETVQR